MTKFPPLDNTAFDRLKGLFADKIESEYFDAVELVKESLEVVNTKKSYLDTDIIF